VGRDSRYAAASPTFFFSRLTSRPLAMIMAFPEVVNSSIEVYMDVSTAYDSPFYGGTYLWGSDFAPSHTRVVNYVQSLNVPLFWEILYQTLSKPKQCVDGVPAFV